MKSDTVISLRFNLLISYDSVFLVDYEEILPDNMLILTFNLIDGLIDLFILCHFRFIMLVPVFFEL